MENSKDSAKVQGRLFWNRRLKVLTRWLHIYLSMVSFAVVFFFAVTGLTLNHADKFGNKVSTKEKKGNVPVRWVNATDTARIARDEIVRYFQQNLGIRGSLSDYRVDDAQCDISFKGPGYAADVFIERQTGAYEMTESRTGLIGILNDLHKGRDTGKTWSLLIDISAVLLTLISVTGILLLLFLKKKRASGLILAAMGLILAWVVYGFFVK